MSMDATRALTTPAGSPDIVQITELLAQKNSKAALKHAKQFHKQVGTPQSESLLVDTYLSRIGSLIHRGLTPEAKSLLNLLHGQHLLLESKQSLALARYAAMLGDVSALIAPLADAALSQQQRQAIQRIITCDIINPAHLARSAALPADHPLRAGAAAIVEALAAVTAGPVNDQQIALGQVSRHSPLAPWKLLVRAIALAYQGDSQRCQRCLDMIDPQSAPARAIPVLFAMTDSGCLSEALTQREAILWQELQPNQQRLRETLERLDQVFDHKRPRVTKSMIREAVTACQKCRPDLLDKLRQHISVWAILHDVPVHLTQRGLDKPSLKNAYFWKLFARAMEYDHMALSACAAWAEFLRHGIHEQWFSNSSAQVAAVYLRMADLLQRVGAHEFESIKEDFLAHHNGFAGFYPDQPKSIRALAPKQRAPLDLYFLDTDDLYRRACGIDPQAEVFARWHGWAGQSEAHGSNAQQAAEAWHLALPGDPRPLLHLMEAAEHRGALKKALGYLDDAEALDALCLPVRQARFRLLVATARRHLKRGQAHLLANDVAALVELPQGTEDDRPAVVAALRVMLHLLGNDQQAAAEACDLVKQQLDSPSAADLLISAVATTRPLALQAAKLIGAGSPKDKAPSSALPRSVARACVAAQDAELTIDIPPAMTKRLIKELDKLSAAVDPAQLQHLADMALERGEERLAYATAGAGLRRCPSESIRARLLLVRAASMLHEHVSRPASCLRVAGALARRHRDDATASRALELFQRVPHPWDAPEEEWKQPLDEKQLQDIVETECKAKAYPRQRSSRFNPFGLFDSLSPSPRRSGRRGKSKANTPFQSDFDDDRDDDPSDLSDLMSDEMMAELCGDQIPLEVLPILLEMAAKHGKADGKLPDPIELMENDPDLADRMAQAMGMSMPFEDMPLAPFAPKRRKPKRKHKRKRQR